MRKEIRIFEADNGWVVELEVYSHRYDDSKTLRKVVCTTTSQLLSAVQEFAMAAIPEKTTETKTV